MKLQETKTEIATIRLLAPRIVENIIHDYVTLDIENVREIKEINKKLVSEHPYAVLVDSGLFTSITMEARKLSASSEFAESTVAKALLVRSLGHRMVGQFYIKVNKPRINTKIFSDREQAIEWLKGQLPESAWK